MRGWDDQGEVLFSERDAGEPVRAGGRLAGYPCAGQARADRRGDLQVAGRLSVVAGQVARRKPEAAALLRELEGRAGPAGPSGEGDRRVEQGEWSRRSLRRGSRGRSGGHRGLMFACGHRWCHLLPADDRSTGTSAVIKHGRRWSLGDLVMVPWRGGSGGRG